MTTRWGVRGVAGRESFETRSAIIRNAVAYIVILTACGLIIWFAIAIGTALQNPAALTNTLGPQRIAAARITNNLHNNLRSPLGILLTQIVLIVLAARVLSHFASKLRQPRVVGEMVAGILLGPSLLGLLSPAAVGFLFPPSSMDTLKMFSELGAILFMFRVGMDFDVQHLLKHAYTA